MTTERTVGAMAATTSIRHRIQAGIRVVLPILGLGLLTWSILWPGGLSERTQSFVSGIGTGIVGASLFIWILVWRQRRGIGGDLADSVVGPIDERLGMIVRSTLALMGVVAFVLTLVAACLFAFAHVDPMMVIGILLWAQMLAYMIGFVWYSRHH